MHPIERLRYVARAGDVPVEPLVRESAGALATFADDPTGLLTACRRLLERRPASAPLVWLCARMLSGADPRLEARDVVAAIAADPTDDELAHALPADVTVCLIGGGEISGRALLGRPDLSVLLVDPVDDAHHLLRALDEAGHRVESVPTSALDAAVEASEVVVFDAAAAAPGRMLGPAASLAAAAVAARTRAETWVAVGVGRLLPDPMWPALGVVDDSVDTSAAPRDGHDARGTAGRRTLPRDVFTRDVVEVPAELVDVCVTPVGRRRPDELARATDCPVVPALAGVGGVRGGRR